MKLKTSLPLIPALSLLFTSTLPAEPKGLDQNGHLLNVSQHEIQGFQYTRLTDGIQFQVNGVTKNLVFYSPKTVRVNANLGQNYWTAHSIVVTAQPFPIDFQVNDSKDSLSVKSTELRIEINKSTGAISFYDAQGKLYTQERQDEPQKIRPYKYADAQTYEVENTFHLKKDEAIYGFGFLAENESNRRGKELLLIQTNMGIVIPVMMSSENYGILWDTYSVMKFKDDDQGAKLWAESAPGGVDYYFMAGNNLDEVVADYRNLTGKAPMYPKQAFGLFMSKERYKTQERLVEVAKTFRKEQFPLDYIVQDWQYWGSDKDGTWSGMMWNPERYPDPEGMTKTIHDLNMKLMVSIWPSVGNDTVLGKELDEYGLRFEPLHWISKKAKVYDAFSKKGREIYFKHAKEGLLDKGVDALWMDGTEVEVTTACWGAKDVARDIKSLGNNAMGDFSRYLNPYTLMTTQGTYDGQRATSNKRVFTLTRSAWAGAQRTAATSWSGDIYANWNIFQQQVADGINVTVTGNPYWTQDTGGFFVTEYPGGEHNPAYRELFARWLQFSAFNPIMRIHGTSIEREPYIFKTMDPKMYVSLLDTVHLRYKLLPYIYSLSWQVTHNNYTLMRPLVMDFSTDKSVYDINDSFMFGSSLLVHPVTRAMYHVTNPPPSAIPSDYLRTPDGKPGLAGQYFAGENFEKPMEKVIDLKIDHNWPGPPLADPPGGLDGFNNFSAKWEGYLVAPEDGTYEIGLEGDDGFRLFLNDEMVIQDWNYGAKRYRSVKKDFDKGDKIPVRVEYYQGGQDRFLRLGWRTPSDLKKIEQANSGLDLNQETYLPSGANWYDFWNNKYFTGGQTVTREVPLNTVPLYVRAGSILPMGPVLQYATEQPNAPYKIRIYPGADASFTLYEDDNETYNYEKGEYATYDLVWDDASKTLSIGPRKGTFPELVKERILNISLIQPGEIGGLDAKPSQVKTVNYTGSPVIVNFD
jgi:alpha-D-xyloside xylohydrolase